MRNNLPPMVVNPVSLLGAVMAVFSLVIIVVLLLLGATGAVANPYTGILAFMVGPAVLAFGLILIPLGVIRERRRRARFGLVGETFPVLNLNDATQRRGITFFAAATAALLLLMTVTTWGAAEYMESTEFCGKVCHNVMQPEDAAYEASPHARVHCVSCHIGPGAPWLVRSKISGIRQVFAVTLNSYPRPIPVPIEDLRPSRDTCEQCHWPERFYGDRLRNFVHYTDDQQNTLRSQPLVFRVGGSEVGAGIHWHTTAKLWYLPLDDKRQEIGWVKVERADGSVDEYTLPAKQAEITPQRIQQDQRFMDCIDCHNRAAHHFEPIESEIDKEIFSGTISPAIPFIKQQAMKAIGTVGEGISQDQYNQAISRINGIEEYYRTQQADAYAKMTPEIKKAVSEIRSTYQRSFFPHMNVTPESYPEWRGHEGCFRCHGKLVGTKGSATGQTVSSACLNCHYPSQVAPPPPTAGGAAGPQNQVQPLLPATVSHPVQGRENCVACHMPGAPGAGTPGGLGMPADHQGRTSDICLGCHAVTQAPAAAPAATAAPTTRPAAPTAAPTAAPAAPAPAASPGPTQAPSGQPTVAPVQPTSAPVKTTGGPAAIPHPVQGREQCSTCHTPGGPGVGSPGGLGMPADHQGRPDASCTGCHKPA